MPNILRDVSISNAMVMAKDQGLWKRVVAAHATSQEDMNDSPTDRFSIQRVYLNLDEISRAKIVKSSPNEVSNQLARAYSTGTANCHSRVSACSGTLFGP